MFIRQTNTHMISFFRSSGFRPSYSRVFSSFQSTPRRCVPLSPSAKVPVILDNVSVDADDPNYHVLTLKSALDDDPYCSADTRILVALPKPGTITFVDHLLAEMASVKTTIAAMKDQITMLTDDNAMLKADNAMLKEENAAIRVELDLLKPLKPAAASLVLAEILLRGQRSAITSHFQPCVTMINGPDFFRSATFQSINNHARRLNRKAKEASLSSSELLFMECWKKFDAEFGQLFDERQMKKAIEGRSHFAHPNLGDLKLQSIETHLEYLSDLEPSNDQALRLACHFINKFFH